MKLKFLPLILVALFPLQSLFADDSVSGPGGTFISQFLDEGSNLTRRSKVNWTGSGISCVDNSALKRLDCTITTTGGGGTSAVFAVNYNDVLVSSPTSILNFMSPFSVSLQGGTSAQIGLSKISLSTGVVGIVDISTQTNLTASSPLFLSGDALGISAISLSTGVVGPLSISSGTVTQFYAGTVTFADGSQQYTAASSASGDITAVNAGTGLTGGGLSGSVTLNVDSTYSGFIHNTDTLQSGATAYPDFLKVGSSGAQIFGPLNVDGLITASGTVITTAAGLLDATKLTGTVPNASIDGSSVTKQGNAFNGASQLLQLNGSADVPDANLSANVTLLGSSIDISAETNLSAASPLILSDDEIQIDPSSVTVQGTLLAGTGITLTPGAGTLTIASTGGGGGGSSTLAVGTGTASNFTNNVTSPTAAIAFNGVEFRSSAVGTTNYIQLEVLDVSSGSVRGPLIVNNEIRLSSAIILSGSAGSFPQVMTSAGTGATPTWEGELTDGSDVTSVDFQSRTLNDISDVISVNYGGRTLVGSTGGNAIDWENRTTRDSGGVDSIDWNARTLKDSSSFINSLHWNDRTLLDSAGSVVLDWTTMPVGEDNSLSAGAIAAGTLPSDVIASSASVTMLVSSFPATGVTAGSYTNTNLTVDAQGRISAASNGSGGSGTTIYNATSTAGFPYGLNAGTITVNGGGGSSIRIETTSGSVSGGFGPQVRRNYIWNKVNEDSGVKGTFEIVTSTDDYSIGSNHGPNVGRFSRFYFDPASWAFDIDQSAVFFADITGLSISTGKSLLLYDSGGANFAAIRAPTSPEDYTLVLPLNDGDADEVLSTDGSGNLDWVPMSGGGGGASTLAVGTGTAASFTNNVSSPTGAMSFDGQEFRVLDLGSTAYIQHEVLDVSSGTVRGPMSLMGSVDLSSAPIFSSYINRFSTGIPSPAYRFPDFLNRNGSDVNRYRLREFTTVKQVNNSITGAVGVSGAAYIPEVDLMLTVDNNNTSFHVFDAARVSSTKLGEVDLSGFTDPEALEYLWTLYDSSAQPIGCVIAITEEQTNHIILSTWAFANVNGTITKSASTIILPQGMWTPDATEGMEGLTYNPFTNELYAAKQGGDMEFRVIPLDGTLNPQAYEPFDAEALWSSSFTQINDLTFDPNTRTVIGIADELSASNANQDIFRFNPQTGALIEWWDNYVTDLGFNTTTWPQSEGIAITPDGKNLFVTSEGTNIAWLTNVSTGGSGSSPFTLTSTTITQTTADSSVKIDKGADGTSYPLRLVNDANGFGDSDMDTSMAVGLSFEYYDNNELESTQVERSRGRIIARVNPLAAGAVQQESGGMLEFGSTLGSGTHGTNTRVTNAFMNEFGHTIISSTTGDLGAKFQVIASSNEHQMVVQGFLGQTHPIAVIENSAGVDQFQVYPSSVNFPFGFSSSTGVFSGAVSVTGAATTFGTLTVNDQISSVLDSGTTVAYSITGGELRTTIDFLNAGGGDPQETGYVGLRDEVQFTSATYMVMGGNPSKTPTGNRNDYLLVNISTQSGESGKIWIPGYDCSGNTNSGALTVGTDGKLVCSDDDSSAGGGDNLGSHVATMTITAGQGISASTGVFSTTVRTGDGTVSAPGFAFVNEPTSGMYLGALADIRFATNGSASFLIRASNVRTGTGVQFQTDDGSAAAPSHSFFNDSDSGVTSLGANQVGMVAGGVVMATFTSTTQYVKSITWPDGTVQVSSPSAGGSGVGVTGSTGSITIAYDGGGSALVSGSTRCVTVPYSCTVSSWTLVADQSGSMAVHVASSTFDNYPTLSNMSGFGNGPSVSSLQKRSNNTTSWTGTTLGAGSQVCGVLDSASTITWASVVLWVIK